jgi:hypothetical protein
MSEITLNYIPFPLTFTQRSLTLDPLLVSTGQFDPLLLICSLLSPQ